MISKTSTTPKTQKTPKTSKPATTATTSNPPSKTILKNVYLANAFHSTFTYSSVPPGKKVAKPVVVVGLNQALVGGTSVRAHAKNGRVFFELYSAMGGTRYTNKVSITALPKGMPAQPKPTETAQALKGVYQANEFHGQLTFSPSKPSAQATNTVTVISQPGITRVDAYVLAGDRVYFGDFDQRSRTTRYTNIVSTIAVPKGMPPRKIAGA